MEGTTLINQMVDRVRSILCRLDGSWRNTFDRRFANSNTSINNISTSLNQNRRVQSAENYMEARLAGRNDDVLKLVADDVILQSSRDGRVEGKQKLRDYITRVKATGSWKKPTWNNSLGVAEVLGNVRILMLSIPVVARFTFNGHGKISRISIGTRRKLSDKISK